MRDGEWAGEAELLAASRSYGVCITCYAVTPVRRRRRRRRRRSQGSSGSSSAAEPRGYASSL